MRTITIVDNFMLRVFECPMSQSAFYLLHDMHLRNYFRVRICSIFFQMLDPSFRSYYALYGCTTTITACVATTKLLACLLAEVATPAESRCAITAASLVIMPTVSPSAGFDFAVNVTCLIMLPSLGFCICYSQSA